MAISFDAVGSSGNTAGTASGAFTWSHVVGTGTDNTRLLVFVGLSSLTAQGTTVGGTVTADGVAMSFINNVQIHAGTRFIEGSVWGILNPTTGSITISVTPVWGAAATLKTFGASQTYLGCGTTLDTGAVNSGTAAGHATCSPTTVADNDWVAGMGYNISSIGTTMVPDQTPRVSASGSSGLRFETSDTNAAVTPPGVTSFGYTPGGTGVVGWVMLSQPINPPAVGSAIDSMGTFSGFFGA